MDYFSAIIGVLGTVLGGILSYAAFFRNSKKDSESEGKEAGTILTELGYIKGGIDDLKSENREQRKTNTEIISRLAAVESSTKSAHKRIDRIEGLEHGEGAHHEQA